VPRVAPVRPVDLFGADSVVTWHRPTRGRRDV